jgi:hypothetical protein
MDGQKKQGPYKHASSLEEVQAQANATEKEKP